MQDTSESEHKTSEIQNIISAISKELETSSLSSLSVSVLLLNIVVLFARPQYLVPASFLTIPLFIVCFFIWLSASKKNITPQIKLMTYFLAFQSFICLVGYTFLQDLVVNDGRAFFAWRNLTQTFLCFLFPLAVILPYFAHLQKFFSLFSYVGLYLAVYVITHSGRGPGDFLGDENDACLALVMFLGLSLVSLLQAKSFFSKIIRFVILAVIVAGIVVTSSRGGFIGFAFAMLYLFWISPKKLLILLSGVVLLFAALPFVPAEYIKEVESIQDVSGGTARSRREMWKAALKVWQEPQYTLTGVGLDNIPWQMYRYFPQGSGLISFGGRSVHSTWIQILTETGLIGAMFFLYLFWKCIMGNRFWMKECEHMRKKLQLISPEGVGSNEEEKFLATFRAGLIEKTLFIQRVLRSTNIAWIGVLGASAFISILYFPVLWFLMVLSGSIQLFCAKLERGYGELMSLPQYKVAEEIE